MYSFVDPYRDGKTNLKISVKDPNDSYYQQSRLCDKDDLIEWLIAERCESCDQVIPDETKPITLFDNDYVSIKTSGPQDFTVHFVETKGGYWYVNKNKFMEAIANAPKLCPNCGQAIE